MTDIMPPASKRLRANDGAALVSYQQDEQAPIRTSSLAEPTMKLTGHAGSIYCLGFCPLGETLASGSFDMKVLLWNAASGKCENYNVLEGHKNAVLDLAWSNGSGQHLATASADKTIGWWNAASGDRVKRFQGHDGIVNAVDTPKMSLAPLVASASDDCTARLWDARVSRGGETAQLQHDYQVTAVAYADETSTIYTGGLDNCIHAWDLRKTQKRVYTIKAHQDTITSLSLHPKGTHLLSNSMDKTLQTWDVRPFCEGNHRHAKTFRGATHNAEKGLLKCCWSADGNMVTGGSADGMVHIWDELTTEELYLLPGHSGCVNSVVFHPKENVIASGSSDKTIYVGELG